MKVPNRTEEVLFGPGARWRRFARFSSRWTDLAIIVTAMTGLWLFWSQYSNLSTLSWGYERRQSLRAGASLEQPDYDLTTLPWQLVRPRDFKVNEGKLTLVTNTEPFAYQAFATVSTAGAAAADIQFDADVATIVAGRAPSLSVQSGGGNR